MVNYYFEGKQQAARELGMSPHTLDRYRQQGLFLEGLHWVKATDSPTAPALYNMPLCKDKLQNRKNPPAHARAINHYLGTLPSNQRAKVQKQVADHAKALKLHYDRRKKPILVARAELEGGLMTPAEAIEAELDETLEAAYWQYATALEELDNS